MTQEKEEDDREVLIAPRNLRGVERDPDGNGSPDNEDRHEKNDPRSRRC